MADNILEVQNLTKHFEVSNSVFSRNKKIVKAVDGISFHIKAGETLGLVGQSGCGKTTTARALCLLVEKTSGEINFYNSDTKNMESIDNLNEEELKSFRRNIQMIFQDPYESLNPRWNIKDIILEPLNIRNIGDLKDREEAVYEILKTVGLTPPENHMPRYPHELSGWQRQRVSIARTLIMKPKFVVCDEPTSMLDVSIRISIMDLMLNLAKDLEVSYLYITHDLAVARYMCDRIAVMFNGKIVEIAQTEELLSLLVKKINEKYLACHFHDTYGQALSNIYAVLQMGVQTLDTSVAGLGGCPYAKGATGNVATEDVLYMLNGIGIKTGIELEKIIKVSWYISNYMKRLPNSRVARAYINQ